MRSGVTSVLFKRHSIVTASSKLTLPSQSSLYSTFATAPITIIGLINANFEMTLCRYPLYVSSLSPFSRSNDSYSEKYL